MDNLYVAMCENNGKFFFRQFELPEAHRKDPVWYYMNEVDLFNVVYKVFTMNEYLNLRDERGNSLVKYVTTIEL
jgi:hypothetical protein